MLEGFTVVNTDGWRQNVRKVQHHMYQLKAIHQKISQLMGTGIGQKYVLQEMYRNV